MPRQSSKIECTCKFCDRIFLVHRSSYQRGEGIYCSPKCYRDSPEIPLIDRFFRFIGRKQTNGCIPWIGGTGRNGYGSIAFGRTKPKTLLVASRVSYELFRGQIPDGLYVLHDCPDGDNPNCVNPYHLFLGTQADNMADMAKKGRSTRGIRNAQAKLTYNIAQEIRKRYAESGLSQSAIAREFCVSQATICNVVKNNHWTE